MKKECGYKIGAVVLFVGVLFLVCELTGLRESFSLVFLRDTIEANLAVGLIVFITAFAIGNLVQIPGWIFLAASVLALGEVMGGIATYVAAVCSCLVTYGVIGYLGNNALRELDSLIAQGLFRRLDSKPVSSIVLLRVLFQTVPVLNYTLALSGVKFRHYLLGTLMGLPVPIFIYCVFFEFLAEHVFSLSV